MQAEAVLASQKDIDGWRATDKFTVVLETEVGTRPNCVPLAWRGQYPKQVGRSRRASQDFNEKPVLTLKEHKELERLLA